MIFRSLFFIDINPDLLLNIIVFPLLRNNVSIFYIFLCCKT